MAYRSRLIHRTAVYRAAPGKSDTGVAMPRYGSEPVSGLETVRCLLISARNKRMMEAFGPDAKADALVLFEMGMETQLRPNLTTSDGMNDLLVLTDKGGNPLGKWAITSILNPGSAELMAVAAVTRVTG